MLTYFAQKISSFFILQKVIQEDDRPIYDYCFEILLSTILNFCTILAIAIISNTVAESLCFIIGFMVVRSAAGGYHADTHMACFLILLSSYLVYLFLIFILQEENLIILAVAFCMISIVIVMIFSPVEDKNKPITKEEKIVLRKKSFISLFILSFVSIGLSFIFNHAKMGFSVSAGMLNVSLSLIAGTLKNNKLKTDKQEG